MPIAICEWVSRLQQLQLLCRHTFKDFRYVESLLISINSVIYVLSWKVENNAAICQSFQFQRCQRDEQLNNGQWGNYHRCWRDWCHRRGLLHHHHLLLLLLLLWFPRRPPPPLLGTLRRRNWLWSAASGVCERWLHHQLQQRRWCPHHTLAFGHKWHPWHLGCCDVGLNKNQQKTKYNWCQQKRKRGEEETGKGSWVKTAAKFL